MVEDNFLLLISTTTTGRNNPLKWDDKYRIPIEQSREKFLSTLFRIIVYEWYKREINSKYAKTSNQNDENIY